MSELVHRTGHSVDGLALIDVNDAVWRTFARPWWDITSWLWFWMSPAAKRWVYVRDVAGQRVRVRALRVSRRHVRVGGVL